MAKKVDNATEAQTEVTVAPKEKRFHYDIKKASISELIEYKTIAEMAFDYYDNLVKANTGTYTDFNASEYKPALDMRDKYEKLTVSIFEEIKERVDCIE